MDSSEGKKYSIQIFIQVRNQHAQTCSGDPKAAHDEHPPEPPYWCLGKYGRVLTEEEIRELLKRIGKKALIYGGAFGTSAIILGGGAFAVLNVLVPKVGFGVGGIAAGSKAAGMMSSAALASGGGVAAGSTVALLQSLGATGIGAAAAAKAGTAAAALGTAAAGAGKAMHDGIRFFMSRGSNRDQGTQTENSDIMTTGCEKPNQRCKIKHKL